MISKRNALSLGYSLVEILATVAILAILATLSVSVSISEADRAKINAAQIGLAGWLQLVQRSALLQKSLQTNQGGCTVTFASTFNNQGNGTQIASVSPASCAPNSSFQLEVPDIGSSRLSASFTPQTLIFTPRGTIESDDASPLAEVRFTISGSLLLRCIRISGLAGVMEIGSRGSGSTLSNQCSDYTRI